MKLLFIILLFISAPCLAQEDSVQVLITKKRTTADGTYMWYREVKSKTKYMSFCRCDNLPEEKQVVWIARKLLMPAKNDYR